jgi:L-aspartate oxidase
MWRRSLFSVAGLQSPLIPAEQLSFFYNYLILLKDMVDHSDYLSIGSGVAGLCFAIHAARDGATVSIVTKKAASESNTRYAQGGIATVVGGDDSIEAHIRDTLDAGAGLCDAATVEAAIREGPQRVDDLLGMGAQFSREEDGRLSLGREGGHSYHRVVHADDWTGRELVRTLLEAAKAEERVSFYEDHQALDLIVDSDGHCCGAWVQHGANTDGSPAEITAFEAPVTLLATGGAGGIFASTTNPSVATGDGIAMAYRAGATVGNLEFVQFHPTALAYPEGSTFLITEALRGYGAVVVNHEGEAFVDRLLQGGSLATRDVVAQAIVAELKSSGKACVFLDVTGKDPEQTRRRFPNIYRTCMKYGIDMTIDPIPVAPAAHYFCGGVRTDIDGCTDVPGLYAAGEVAHTGFHGANRLASNSLLEGLVFGTRAARHAGSAIEIGRKRRALSDPPILAGPIDPERAERVSEQIGRIMLEEVGIVRSNASLLHACDSLDALMQEVTDVELQNKLTVARLVAQSARARRESRGVHFNADHPERDDENWQHDSLMQAGR